MNSIKHGGLVRMVAVALSVAMAIALTASTRAQTTEKGAQKLVKLVKLQTEEDLAALAPGDMVAMSCPKCKTVTVTYIQKEAKMGRTREVLSQKDLCPGCDTAIKIKGHGKQAKRIIIHTCKECGSQDAFCCVMKKAAEPTKGMEQHQSHPH